MPLSQRQLNANRANSKKSTGPKTPEGKAASARNATTHGLTSTALHTADAVCLGNEERSEFHILQQSLIACYNPRDTAEALLVEEIVAAKWRIRRSWAMETALMDDEMDNLAEAIEEKYEDGVDQPTRAALAFQSLTNGGTSLEGIQRYEARLMRNVDRALRHLRQGRRDAAEEWASNNGHSATGDSHAASAAPGNPPERPSPAPACGHSAAGDSHAASAAPENPPERPSPPPACGHSATGDSQEASVQNEANPKYEHPAEPPQQPTEEKPQDVQQQQLPNDARQSAPQPPQTQTGESDSGNNGSTGTGAQAAANPPLGTPRVAGLPRQADPHRRPSPGPQAGTPRSI